MVVVLNRDLEEIIPSFLENRHKDLEQISCALEREDYSTITSLGHRLAGSAPSYGLVSLGEMGRALEKAATEEDRESLEELFKSYQSYMEALEIRFE